MIFDGRRQTHEIVHGVTALILGLFLLGVGSSMGVSKYAADLLGRLLYLPEYPALYLRGVFHDWAAWLHSKSAMQVELERLRDENRSLRLANSSLANNKIAQDVIKFKLARVSLRAPLSWWNEIRIDNGERDGVVIGVPIFNNGYLVGRVSSVSESFAWAELITSPSLMIPAVVEETRELGVVVGDGDGSVFLNYIPAGRGLTKGMKVSTALIGEQLPPGLPIGVIAEEIKSTSGGYASYKITPGADLSQLYGVSLLEKRD